MQATAEWLDTNYYAVLGVDPDATTKQIKSAYRKLARSAHPDANPDDPTADARFSDIAKAYEVLGDSDQRTEYDNLRLQAQRQPIDPGHGRWSSAPQDASAFVDINDLFGDLFAEQQRRPRRGTDLSASLALDFADAVQGLTTSLQLEDRTINVRIPAGVKDQQTIRLAGKGSTGANGGPAGDLLIKISVSADKRFARAGNDLTVTIPVRYEDAVLGADVAVPTLGGETVTVRMPPGTSANKKFRVAGHGVPRPNRSGDLLVSVSIDVPSELTPAERELLEQLRSLPHLKAA